jgi:serine/threonine protein phosphatase PrpC
MHFKGYSITAIGSREMNQDSLLCDNDRALYAVADGIGGGLRGEVASLMAVTGLGAHPEEGKLSETFRTLQAAIFKEALDSIGEALMGTTLTAILLSGHTGEVCHVGDSRCYLYSGNVMHQLTEDHESYDETMQAPVLSSYLGIPEQIHPLTIQEEIITVKGGDRLLICSDGLYKQISESRMAEVIRDHVAKPEEILQILSTEAAKHEYSDNISIVYIECFE